MSFLGDVQNTLANLDSIADVLGLRNWDLQQASYNGVIFHMNDNSAFNQVQGFNPLAGPTQAVVNAFEDGSISGLVDSSTTNNKNLPYGTKSLLKNMDDTAIRKLVKHKIPNKDGDIFEDLGFQGEEFTGVGIVFGSAYYSALENFYRYFINDNTVAETNRHVLIHPIRGKIENTYLEAYKITHVYNKWRACVFEFKFASENVGTSKVSANSWSSMLSQGLSDAEGLAGGLGTISSDVNLLNGLF